MASTYVNDLRLNELATGDGAGTWGTTTNTNLELIGEAFSFGTEAITTNADTHTTTIADGSTDPGRSMYLKYTGTLDSACTITIGPNTVSKMWFIENGTSGSQNIIISQGSGANITIPPGDVKVVYSDGAGSGAAVVDAFASLSVVDLKVQDDLTVTDDVAIGGLATVGGTLGVTGIATFTDDIIIGDGKTIGSASDVDAMTIASNGQVTFTQTLIGTALDISGDIDVDGTTNLDVVDIDGAVDMASTLTVAGVLTGASLDISGDIDVDGTTNLDVVDIDGAVDFASTTAHAGNATFVDNAKAIFGTGSDLEIYHDGSNSYISESNDTGNLFIKGTNIYLQNSSGQDALNLINGNAFIKSGGATKLATTSTGIDVTGTVKATAADSQVAVMAAGDISDPLYPAFGFDGQIGSNGGRGAGMYLPADGTLAFSTAGSERLRIDSSGNVGIGNTQATAINNASGLGNLVVGSGSGAEGITIYSGSDSYGGLNFADATSGGGSYAGYIKFNHVDNSFGHFIGNTERMRIDSSGSLLVNTTSAGSNRLKIVGDASRYGILSENLSGYGAFSLKSTTVAQTWSIGAVDNSSNSDLFIYGGSSAGTKVTLASSGNVGIGTDSPDSVLHVSDTSQPKITIEDSTNNSFGRITGGGSTGSLTLEADFGNAKAGTVMTFNVDNTERMRINSSGNVGIGTANPAQPLSISVTGDGVSGIPILTQSNENFAIGERYKDNADGCNIFFRKSRHDTVGSHTRLQNGDEIGGIRCLGSDGVDFAPCANLLFEVDGTPGDNDMPGRIVFETAPDGTQSPTERMRIDSSGNVGIGTASINANAKLHVQDSDGSYPDDANTHFVVESASHSYIGLGGGTSSDVGIHMGDSGSINRGKLAYLNASDSMVLFTSAVERMRIDSSGNLLVGATSTGATDNGVKLFGQSGSLLGSMSLCKTYSSGTITYLYFERDSGSVVGSISYNGSATAYNTSSDARLKDVTGSARGLEVINELNPVAYNWKADGKADEGLIAQEVKELVPNAVSGSEEDMYQMDYSKLVVHLVAGMKEQQTQIDELKQQIQNLTGE